MSNRIYLYVIIGLVLLVLVYSAVSERFDQYLQERQRIALREEEARMTPLNRAKREGAIGHYDEALRDIDGIPAGSSEYSDAQKYRAYVVEWKRLDAEAAAEQAAHVSVQRARARETPEEDKRAAASKIESQLDRAEKSCKDAVKSREEFPSTVDFKWFNDSPKYDEETGIVTATVNYTAKNSVGAELPYRMTCIETSEFLVTSANRTGR
jgi:sRNA-binding protein